MSKRKRGPRGFWKAWRDYWSLPEIQHEWHNAHHQMHAEMKGRQWREFFFDFMGTWPENHWAFGGRRFNPWMQGDLEFNPFVASLMSKGGGLLPLIVLNLLAERPLYGNEIMELISQRTSGQWLANPGAIYPLLTMLESQGLVKSQWEDPYKRTKRYYEITNEGLKELESMKSIIRPRLLEAVAAMQDLLADLDGDIVTDSRDEEE
ncbi:MAG: PadR family transcriptional regulator [Candidatus Promineifilaceae bacterium]